MRLSLFAILAACSAVPTAGPEEGTALPTSGNPNEDGEKDGDEGSGEGSPTCPVLGTGAEYVFDVEWPEAGYGSVPTEEAPSAVDLDLAYFGSFELEDWPGVMWADPEVVQLEVLLPDRLGYATVEVFSERTGGQPPILAIDLHDGTCIVDGEATAAHVEGRISEADGARVYSIAAELVFDGVGTVEMSAELPLDEDTLAMPAEYYAE